MTHYLGRYRYNEHGATSLIIVMFSVLLFVIVAVGFIQLMNAEQRASADSELSRGAYDSALAGVEDGKRVLKACLDNPDLVNNPACASIEKNGCSTISDAKFVTEKDGQVYLRSVASGGGLTDTQYEQAYTCVKIKLNTPNYIGNLQADTTSSVVIPVKTVETANKLKLQWFRTSISGTGALDPFISAITLPATNSWSAARPPIMRVELINLPQGNGIDTLDTSSGAWTAYLYPKQKGAGITPQYNLQAVDSRSHTGVSALNPIAVWCNDDIATNLSGYVCEGNITLPAGVDTVADGVYLRITALYNGADFSVSPLKDVGASTEDVEYSQVQPAIDSTGKAGDVFRRVEARVETTDPTADAAYPRATIDITNNLCKTLSVTDTYYNGGSCTP